LTAKAAALLQSADQYCKDAAGMLQDCKRKLELSNEHTFAEMKKQIKVTFEVRKSIESEMLETKKTISRADLKLNRVETQLRVALAMPERGMDTGGDGKNDDLSAKTGVLAELRSKIRAAAYCGSGGRDMAVTFGRFDRDGSGELDEEEIRVAIRRACKIPPSEISDVDIIALCELLDEDGSGAISVAELVDFLLADVIPEELESEILTMKDSLDGLKQALDQITLDCQSKTHVWRINEECSKVTPVKGLALDKSPVMHRIFSRKSSKESQRKQSKASQSSPRAATTAKVAAGSPLAATMPKVSWLMQSEQPGFVSPNTAARYSARPLMPYDCQPATGGVFACFPVIPRHGLPLKTAMC